MHQVLVESQKEGGDPDTCQAALLVAALTPKLPFGHKRGSRYACNWFQVVFNYIMNVESNLVYGILLILVKLWNSFELSISAVYGYYTAHFGQAL